MGFITGKKKATEVAHSVWKNIIQKGDTVIDATCGNGYDTLALLTMVSDESYNGCVLGMDIQQEALDNTSSLLEISVEENKRKLVKLFKLCHSKLEDIVRETPVRLVAFNLGYLPGGDKTILTSPGTTVAALHAACRVLQSGGLISVMVYIGHPGGRDELEVVQGFASDLPVEAWTSIEFEMLNRPTAPVLVLIFKK
ncbi:tRNA (mnm(5)s(2)U34)-methyltransferase, chloroplastic isoform X3 [Curcuma longa]